MDKNYSVDKIDAQETYQKAASMVIDMPSCGSCEYYDFEYGQCTFDGLTKNNGECD